MNMDTIIETKNLTKKFGNFTANDHIDLAVKEGEIRAIIGENGAGKSTLMNMLYGILQPTEGEILFRGKKVAIASPRDAIELGIGADLAMAFLTQMSLPVDHVYFDGGQFAQIGRGTRRVMMPFLYLAIKSLYWSKGKTLKKLLWCGDDAIKPYFIAAGRALTLGNLRRQLADSLEDRPFPLLPETLQRRTYFAFGSAEDHFKYREAVRKAYPAGNFPVFAGYDHMQYQIRDPQGFAELLQSLMERDRLPDLPFLRK